MQTTTTHTPLFSIVLLAEVEIAYITGAGGGTTSWFVEPPVTPAP